MMTAISNFSLDRMIDACFPGKMRGSETLSDSSSPSVLPCCERIWVVKTFCPSPICWMITFGIQKSMCSIRFKVSKSYAFVSLSRLCLVRSENNVPY